VNLWAGQAGRAGRAGVIPTSLTRPTWLTSLVASIPWPPVITVWSVVVLLASSGLPSRRFLWVPVVLYMGFIFVLSSITETPALPEGADKNLHALLYFGLGILLMRALSGAVRARVTLSTAVAATVIAGLYGVSDEFHQFFVPPRQMEALDVAADTIGAAAAAFGVLLWARLADAKERRDAARRSGSQF
jgi:VanZ family protein